MYKRQVEELAEAAKEVVEMRIEDTLRIAVEAAVADHLDTRANLAVDTLGFVAHYQRDANRCFSQVWH